jgi:hypothetical protein
MWNKLGALADPRFELRFRASSSVLEFGLLGVLFVISRLVLYAAGLRFELDLRWMFLADPAALRDHLLQSVVYFHAYPPGMNLLTGFLLKLDEAHLAELAHFVLTVSSFVLVASLYYLARGCGLSRAGSLALALVFSLLPQTLFLENLYLYAVPSAALLCLAAVLFHRALVRSSVGRWGAFFAACLALCWLRTTFLLIWFGAICALALFATKRSTRRHVFVGASAPAILLLSLYLKNWLVFDFFGTTSWTGASAIAVTTNQLPSDERDTLISAGKLSPFANINVFAGPAAYVPYFADRDRPAFTRFPGSDQLKRPSVGADNFNHWMFLSINEQRGKDAWYYLSTHFSEFVGTVLRKSLPQFFEPTTHWHTLDKEEVSPHDRHRLVLGGYESLYDGLVHGFPVKGVGLYSLLPLFLVWAGSRAWRLMRSGDAASWSTAMLIVFATLQIVYVTGVSALFSYGESARYRFMVEPLIWLVVASCFSSARRSFAPGPSEVTTR